MLSWLCGAVVVLVLALALVGPGFLSRAAAKSKAPESSEGTQDMQAKPVAPKSRKELALALRRLATTPPPPTRRRGAMCYDISVYPEEDKVTYVCPKDGTQVVYAASEPLGQYAKFVSELRQKAKGLRARGLAAELDESALCPKCARKGQPPGVDLLVRFPDAPEPHRHPYVSSDDLDLIQELLEGAGIHHLVGSETEPLRDSLPRLRMLLGIPDTPDREGQAKPSR
jgi:hypothetical protein